MTYLNYLQYLNHFEQSNYFEYFNWLANNEPDLLLRLIVFTNINLSLHESIQHYNSINELILLKNMGYIDSNWMYYAMRQSKNKPYLCDGIFSNGIDMVTIQYKYKQPYQLFSLTELSTNYRDTDIIQIGTHNTDIYNKQLSVLNNFKELNKSNNNNNPIYIKDYNYLSSPITNKTKIEINNNLKIYQHNLDKIYHQKIMNNYFNGKPMPKASIEIIKLLKK